MTIEAIQKIAIQLTFGLNSIHKTGVCHNDLKPHNIMVNEIRDEKGKVIKHQLQIIDFGLITSFIENGKHITPEQGKTVGGTKNYQPRRAHYNEALSRRDDWETLCFVIYALIKPLPWSKEKDLDKMIQMKEDFMKNQSWKGVLPDVFS